MDQPKWLDEAWRELGQSERPGSADNPRVIALYRDAGHSEIRDDETAWCAAFAGACLKRAGVSGTGSLMARSYLNWGRKLDAPKTGAIAVLSRGSDPALGHVGFLIGESGENVILLAGNQGDAVGVAAFPRARILGLRWPDVAYTPEAMSVSNLPVSGPRLAEAQVFDQALAHVLAMEGGYTDDPFDPGGPTNKGITLRVFAEWSHVTVDALSFPTLRADLKRIPDAVVSDIYRARYWDPAACRLLPPAIALTHFDASVNHGVGTAIRMLQAVVGVDADGDVGPLTVAAVQDAEVLQLLEKYAAARRSRYRALSHFWRFGRGWLARADATLSASRKIHMTTSPTKKGSTTMTSTTAAPSSTMHDTSPSAVPKWWGESVTVWGAVLTALAAVLPALASIGGVSLTPALIEQAGAHIAAAAQAAIALAGTIVTIYGRVKARQPLERREVSLKL